MPLQADGRFLGTTRSGNIISVIPFFPPKKKIDCRVASEIHLNDLIRLGNELSVR